MLLKKLSIRLALALLLGLSACAKDPVSPNQASALVDSTWRMTNYMMEFRPQRGAGSTMHDFFRSYSSNSTAPCLSLNTLTFTAAGQVLWTGLPGGCAVQFSPPYPAGITNVDWGKWEVSDNTSKLTVTVKGALPGRSSLPIVYDAAGSYDIVELTSTSMILGATHVTGQNRDSLHIDRVSFDRVP